MHDVVISGGGPAGAIAALRLARAGARVALVDRARFPRPKLCGDTLNPGAMALLHASGLAAPIVAAGLPIDGMVVTSADGVAVRGLYGEGMTGRAIRRDVLDLALLEAAAAAGAEILTETRVTAPLVTAAAGPAGGARITGVAVRGRHGRAGTLPAEVTIAADGRRSPLAFALGLAAHPRWPRRWAIGAYFDGIVRDDRVGEMHVRRTGYIGVSPSPGGATNICLVTADRAGLDAPAQLLDAALRRDPVLRERCRAAARVSDVVSLGPLAVDVRTGGPERLLLAGDAAGFIDPMTGDGIHLALRGGVLAAEVALDVLAGRVRDGAAELARRRRAAFAFKLRFNRVLRTLVGSPMGVRVGAAGASLLPFVLRRVIALAGDVAAAREDAA